MASPARGHEVESRLWALKSAACRVPYVCYALQMLCMLCRRQGDGRAHGGKGFAAAAAAAHAAVAANVGVIAMSVPNEGSRCDI